MPSLFRAPRLTIFSRLVLGNLLVLLIATGVSVYAILQLEHQRQVTHRITLFHNVLIDLDKEMTNSLLSEIRYEKKFALLQDRKLYEGFLSAKSDFERYLARAMEMADSPKMKEALKRVQNLNESYQSLFEAEVASRHDGGHAPGRRHAAEKDRAVNEAMKDLSELRNLSQQSILRKIKELDRTESQATTVAMTITGAALLFGIALSIGITRGITRPLSRMKKKTAEVAQGVFKADLEIQSPPEIAALAGAFNTMCVKLQEVDRMKSEFYSLMSHELRTPLTSIREGTSMFLEGVGGEVTERQRELLMIMEEESSRLIDLVNRLLELSKLESGAIPIELSEHDLPPLLAQAVRELSPLAAAKSIGIECAVVELPTVSLEPERILQVLRNLIGNALKFTPTGGKVVVAARRHGREVQVSVTDTGPGIPESELPLVFEKFRQASPAAPPRFQGTGLGLAIVRHIVQVHGGRVWVESEVGRGSTFIFALPVC